MIRLMVPELDNTELQSIKKVINSGFVTEGEITSLFEKKFAKYVGARFSIATTSGTTALELALRILKIGKGDEVIIPSFTHPATGNCVLSVGAKPVFADISLDTLNIDPALIQLKISKKTKAVIGVSQFGNPLDVAKIRKLKNKYKFYFVEDAACSIGSIIGNKKIGTQADITCFSLHPRKIITTGQGGMLVTSDKKISEMAKIIKNFGLVKRGDKLVQSYWGTNLKLTDIQAAIGIVQLSKIEKIIKKNYQKQNQKSKFVS